MLKRIVDVVEGVAAALAIVFVVLLFVERTPGTKAPKAVAVAAGSGAAPAAAVNGAAVFQTNCAGCHGANATGGIAPRLAGTVTKLFPDERLENLVVTKGSGRMPPFENRLSEAEIKAVVAYTRSLK